MELSAQALRRNRAVARDSGLTERVRGAGWVQEIPNPGYRVDPNPGRRSAFIARARSAARLKLFVVGTRSYFSRWVHLVPGSPRQEGIRRKAPAGDEWRDAWRPGSCGSRWDESKRFGSARPRTAPWCGWQRHHTPEDTYCYCVSGDFSWSAEGSSSVS